MHLLIVRHAIAVDRGTPGMADAERPLTPEGIKKFKKAAKGLARILERPDAILTSPWRRARETALIAAAAWGGIEPRDEEALTGDRFDDLAQVIAAQARDATVAVIGHEPFLSALLARLLGTRADERLTFKKGGAALVEVPGALGAGGTLVWYLPPAVLRDLAE